MVIGFLKDNRLEEERNRTERERKRADAAEARIQAAEVQARLAEAKVQQERERSEYLLEELNKARERYEQAADAIIQHLRDRGGTAAQDRDSDV